MSSSTIGCPACLNEKSIEAGTKNNYLINQCAGCRTLYARVVFEDEQTAGEVQDLYDHYYDHANFTLHPAVAISLQKVMDSFKGFRKTGKLLDIGFGEGGLLSVAEKNGWECYGTELSPQALKYGTDRNWTVSKDALNDSRFPKEGFDAVTLIELIEHVPNPDDFLQTAYALLRPGGVLYLTTPNTRSLNRRWLGIDWSVISPPEHITIWSPTGMKKALERNKFTPKDIRTEGFNPVEILAQLRAGKDEPAAVNRNEAGYALNEAFTSSGWRRAVKTTINRGLSTLRVGDGIKVWAVK
jgi:2-polyprenyl-3-methyl-5-hydroxy-6-metoxy-1,4-benzoquinol methylase